MAKSLYVVDTHYQIFRAFYAPFRDLTSPTGEPTKAVHVFCQMLFNLIKQRKPDYLAMAMDVSDKTVFRCELDANYKANRDETPKGLITQAERIVSVIQALGVPLFRVSGFEADDVMATIATRLRGEDIDVYLVSRDKDLDQVVGDRVRLYDPLKDEVIDAEAVLANKGYPPAKAVEVQTLVGDSTDNIPGVPGVGPKTAAKLINQYGSVDAVVAHADELTPKLRESIKTFAAQLPITRQLVTLRTDVPLPFDLERCRVDGFRPHLVRPIFRELGFKSLTDQLNNLPGATAETSEPVAEQAEIRATRDELFDDAPTEQATIESTIAPEPTTPPPPPGDYRLVDTPELLDRFVSDIARQTCFAMDTETTGLNPVQAELVGLSFAWKSGEAYYIPVRAAVGRALPRDEVIARLRPVLENPAIAKIGQNIKYDLLVLRQCGVRVAGVSFDTLIASFLLEPLRSSHGIDSLAKTMLGHDMIPITDLIGRGRDQLTMDQVDTQRVCEYAAEDADYTFRLYELLAPRMHGCHAEALFRDVEMPLVECLVEMENNGIAIDTALLKSISRAMEQRMFELTREVHRCAGHPFNIDSTKQLAAVLFDEQGLGVIRTTKTGRSTDADTLEALAAQSDNPIPRLVLEYRELAKLKGTYVDTLPTMICPKTGRIHANFKPTGAVTGRLSSSDPNLQNIPIRTPAGRQIREAFVAGSERHVLITADYSQIELRLLAHFCEDANLIHAFVSGQDIHRAVAAEVNGVPLDQVTGEQRSAAKAVNFGIIYGQSAFGLSRSLGISQTQARDFITRYFARYSGIRAFIDRCVESARRTGYAETILGRRRPIPELTSRNRAQVNFGERIAVNTVVQGSAADLIKKAMVDIHRRLRTGRHAARMLVQVHDELVFEVEESRVDEDAAMIRDCMQSALALRVPLAVDIAWAHNWAEGK